MTTGSPVRQMSLTVNLTSKSGIDVIYNGTYRVTVNEAETHALTAQVAYSYLVSQLALSSPSTMRGVISVDGVVWAKCIGRSDMALLGLWGATASYVRIGPL